MKVLFYLHCRQLLNANNFQSLIQDHATTWGLTADNVDDKNQWGVVTTRVRTRLTDRRYEIKKVVSLSFIVV